MKKILLMACCVVCMAGTNHTFAAEADFLNSIEGSYAGRGTVKLRTNLKPITVRCKFRSSADAKSLSLHGSCTGLLVVSRKISADVNVTGTRYRGTYLGAGTGPASLSGKRRGNAIAFNVRWAKNVNGDREAMLTVTKVGANGMTLTATDRDPKTGELVTTSEIVLQRNGRCTPNRFAFALYATSKWLAWPAWGSSPKFLVRNSTVMISGQRELGNAMARS